MLFGRSLEYEILGDPSKDHKWLSAIVIQGPYSRPHTEIVVREFFNRNPKNTLIIVATYVPAKALLSQWEKETLNTGKLVYLFVPVPRRDEAPRFWETNIWNQNLQRLSSYMGLRYAKSLGIEFSLKCRSDAFLGLENVCEVLSSRFVQDIPPLVAGRDEGLCLKGRIVISDHAKRLRDNIHTKYGRLIGEYHIADHWLFGYTEDLMNFFDIRDGTPEISTEHSVETNLTERWMTQVGISKTEDGIAEIAARYLAIASCIEVEFVWMKKWHDYKRYLRQGKKHLIDALYDEKRSWGPLISHEKWLDFIEYYRNR